MQYVGTLIPVNKLIKNSDKFIAGAGAGVTAVRNKFLLRKNTARVCTTTMNLVFDQTDNVNLISFLQQVTLTYPLDTIRARLAFQVTGEHKYSGIVHTALSVMKNVL